MSACGGLGLLQMVSEPDTGRCASEEIESQRGWTRDGVPARMLTPEGGGLGGGGGSHIDWKRKRVSVSWTLKEGEL